MTRYFFNLPPMPYVAYVETAAAKLGASNPRGYTGPDGSIRACVEIDQTVAELLDRAAIQVELRGCALEAIAESFASQT